jgi:lipoprotein signal peptidase
MDSLANDRNDYRGYYFLTAVVVLLLDQATKAMVSRTMIKPAAPVLRIYSYLYTL